MSPSLTTAVGVVTRSAKGAQDLPAALWAVPDPRPSGIRRHPTAYILAVLLGSFACAGFGSLAAAAQWAASADRDVLLGLARASDPRTRRHGDCHRQLLREPDLHLRRLQLHDLPGIEKPRDSAAGHLFWKPQQTDRVDQLHEHRVAILLQHRWRWHVRVHVRERPCHSGVRPVQP